MKNQSLFDSIELTLLFYRIELSFCRIKLLFYRIFFKFCRIKISFHKKYQKLVSNTLFITIKWILARTIASTSTSARCVGLGTFATFADIRFAAAFQLATWTLAIEMTVCLLHSHPGLVCSIKSAIKH